MRSKKLRYNYPRWIVKAKEFHSLCKIKDASYRYIREYIFEEDVLIITKRKVKRYIHIYMKYFASRRSDKIKKMRERLWSCALVKNYLPWKRKKKGKGGRVRSYRFTQRALTIVLAHNFHYHRISSLSPTVFPAHFFSTNCHTKCPLRFKKKDSIAICAIYVTHSITRCYL